MFSDHHLLVGKVKLRLKKLNKVQDKASYAVEKLANQDISDAFQQNLSNRFALFQNDEDIEVKWEHFKEAIKQSAEQVIGFKRGKRKEQWISDETWKLIDKRREIKSTRDQAITRQQIEETQTAYRTADREVKRHCKRDKSAWIERKSAEAQEAAERNDLRTLYKIVKDLTGKHSSSNVPIKDRNGQILSNEEEQNTR